MITHKSFKMKTGLSEKSILENQEFVRMEAEAFIRNELNEDRVLNISESAVIIPLGMTWTVVSATVWYRE